MIENERKDEENAGEERFREILKIVNEKKNSDCNRADQNFWILQSLRSEET